MTNTDPSENERFYILPIDKGYVIEDADTGRKAPMTYPTRDEAQAAADRLNRRTA